ncbi:hypothetical protein M3Y95_01229200 [Aphelenchoides besseyi]|nr:hypothetical protein M3Y95_01229200 [Aphelenchoides besseyi]
MSVQLVIPTDDQTFNLVPSLQFNEKDKLTNESESAPSSTRSRRMFSQMSSVSEPPSYDEVVNQEQVEKTQRRIWGTFVVYVSHLCGIHPIRAPYFCSLTECKKLKLRERLSWFNIFVCAINLFVSFNHIYLRFFSENFESLRNSKDKARWVQTFVTSLAPPLIIVASTISSSGLDRLIHLISNERVDISQSQNQQRIKKWANLTMWLNFSFAIICTAQLSQIIFMDFISHNFERTTVLDSDFINVQKPLAFCIKRFLVELDRCYFNIMFFAVVKIPQVLIIVVCIVLSVLYRENTAMIAKRQLTKPRLKEFFAQFKRLEEIHGQLESTYSHTILLVVSCMLSIGTVKTYVLIRYLVHSNDRSDFFRIVFAKTEHPTEMSACVIEFGFTLLGIVLNFVWCIGFVLSCVYCNDMSRSAMPILLNKLVDDEAKPTKDQILQKLGSDYGLTMGKFLRMDRSAVITMFSIVFTVVAVWLQVDSEKFKR